MAEVGAVAIMAGGKGTRMRSSLTKVRHHVGGLPMLVYPVLAAQHAGAERVIVITGPDDDFADILPEGAITATQHEANGTGDAVKAAEAAIGDAQHVIVLSGDVPLIDSVFVQGLADVLAETQAAMVVTTARLDDPTGYGRIVRGEDGSVERVVETKEDGDATEDELALDEVNAGIYAFDRAKLFAALAEVRTDNAQGEYYLPDVLPILLTQGELVVAYELETPDYMLGVNDRADLGLVQQLMNARIVNDHQLSGVTVIDPDSTWIEAAVQIGEDTVIEPGTYLRGTTEIGCGATIGPASTIAHCEIGDGATVVHSYLVQAKVGAKASVGPFAYLRPDAELAEGSKVGTFVEIKNSKIGPGAKVPHLSYIGDADVGEGANLGAATITANYDGKNKHRTVIGPGVRTGVDTTLVAPVTVGDGAYTGAGSVITRDVPADALAVARARQKTIENYAQRRLNG
ncbi:MAG: bifunctional UDP-N-acetylglucosamine diphosphorylase/glucosamine-1-phosphate N-acetyltransferase GlmU [Thermoleophilaceae bacterium]|nr:bifunctional UDP-N-acetylglucosamine diphosphorylase/glucosamine-1-phosphate N-acetyltransferase GlmU [Thermoleophilaceae bacterium]